MWKVLVDKIKQAGITVPQNAKAVGFKSGGMEAEYRTAHDFVHNTGQGLMDEGQDITDIVKKMCPFFYLLDPIMGNRASTRWLTLFDSEDPNNRSEVEDDEDSAASNKSGSKADYSDNDENPDNNNNDDTLDVEAVNEETAPTRQKRKRPITLVDDEEKKKKKKVHPAVEFISNLNTALESSQ